MIRNAFLALISITFISGCVHKTKYTVGKWKITFNLPVDNLSENEAKGRLLDYFLMDCTASLRDFKKKDLETVRNALYHHDIESIRRIITDYHTFGSGDSEAYMPLRWNLLHVIGDDAYADAVAPLDSKYHSPYAVPFAALDEKWESYLKQKFPRTYKLTNEGR